MDENTVFKGNLRAFPQQIAVQSIAEDQEALAGNFWVDVWAGSPIAKEKSQVKSITWLRSWRRERDSNPRYGITVYRISSPAHSTTLPSLRKGQAADSIGCAPLCPRRRPHRVRCRLDGRRMLSRAWQAAGIGGPCACTFSAIGLIAAKPVKPCDGGVFQALNLLLFLQ